MDPGVNQNNLFAQVDLFSFGADLIIFKKQFNEILLYLTKPLHIFVYAKGYGCFTVFSQS